MSTTVPQPMIFFSEPTRSYFQDQEAWYLCSVASEPVSRRSAIKPRRSIESSLSAPRGNPVEGGKLRQVIAEPEVNEPSFLQLNMEDKSVFSNISDGLAIVQLLRKQNEQQTVVALTQRL